MGVEDSKFLSGPVLDLHCIEAQDVVLRHFRVFTLAIRGLNQTMNN